MLSFLFYLLCIFFLGWLVPRVFWLLKTLYFVKKQMKNREKTHWNSENIRRGRDAFGKNEKDISHKVKIVEEKTTEH